MKKFLIFLILFTSIIIVGNAKAEIINFDELEYNGTKYDLPMILPDKPNDEILEKYQNNILNAKQYYKENCVGLYDSYIIDINGFGYGWGDNQVNLLCFNSENNDYNTQLQIKTGARFGRNNRDLTLSFDVYKSKNNENDVLYVAFYDTNKTYINQFSNDKEYRYVIYNSYTLFNYDGGIVDNLYLDRTNGIVETNVDFGFGTSNNSDSVTWADGFIIDDVLYNSENLIYKNGEFVGNKPTITFSKTENTENVNDTELVTSVDLNVKFSSIDNEKYIYRYKVLPSENWTTMTLTSKDNFDIHLTSNTSVVVEILDLETKESITSSTYTIDSISDIDVSISITKKEDLNCIANYNNTQVETCANLDIYFSYINFDKYYYQYSIDNGNNYINIKSDDIKNNIFNYILNNEYLIVRVIDKTTKVEKAINTYTFSKFQEIPKEPYINFEIYYTFDMCAEDEIGTTICVNYEMMKSDKFNEIDKNKVEIRNMSATLFVKIYNYNENYNYYYYDDTGGCIKITKSLLKNDGYSYYYTSIDLYSNVQVTVDIHDENNNYLKSYTYTVNGFENEKKETTFESMLEKIKSIFKNDNNIFDYFNTIYTKLRDSKIGTYLYFVIISSIILLIINALQR